MAYQPHGHRGWKRVLILTAGWGCIAIGIIGGFIPVLQGWVFNVAGLLILSTEYEWAHDALEWTRRRFPRFAAAMDNVRSKAEGIVRRITGKASQE